ncbi:MAG: arsenate reductase ArsC [Dehalococcoidia bacterium]
MKTLLFVCVHNSGRSQMAEAFFNSLAGGAATAVSAGTDPAEAVDPAVVEAMREVGVDISGNRPKALTIEMVEGADRVVTMGCEVDDVCPAALVETEDWGLEDPGGKPPDRVREIRDEIRARVFRMLNEAGFS